MKSRPRSATPVEGPQNSLRALLVGLGLFLGLSLVAMSVLIRWEDAQVVARKAEAIELAHAHLRLFSERLNGSLSAARVLAELVRQGNGTVTDFPRVAGSLMTHFPGVAALQLAPGGTVSEVSPLAGNEDELGRNLLEGGAAEREARQAVRDRRLTVAGPFQLAGGDQCVVGRLPVFLPDGQGGESLWGLASVFLRFPTLLKGTGVDRIPERNFEYALWSFDGEASGATLIASSGGKIPPDAVELGLPVPNGQWRFSLSPRGGWSDPGTLWGQRAVALGLCLLLAYLLQRIVMKPVVLRAEVDRRTRALRESEERFRTVVRSIPDLVWLKDPEGRYLGCNRRFEKFFGVPVSELVGKTDEDFADTQFIDASRVSDRDVLERRTPSVTEQWITFASDGHCELVQTVRTPMFSASGKLIGVLCVARDITDLHEMTEGYKRSEARLNAAQQLARIGSWERNLDTGEIYWSDEIFRMFELDPETVTPHYDVFMETIHPDDREWVNSVYREAQRQGKPLQVQMRLKTRSGRIRHVEMRAEMPEDEQGDRRRVVGTLQDISIRVEAQEKIRAQQAMARAMLAAMPVGVAITDAEGRLREFNAAAIDLLQVRPLELAGKRLSELGLAIRDSRGAMLTAAELPDARALGEQVPVAPVELQLTLREGTVELEMSAVPVAGDDMGVVIAMVSLAARREAEASMRENAERIDGLNRRFSIAAAAAGIGVWEYDLAGQSFSWDEAMFRLHGVGPDRFDGSLAGWLECIAAPDRARMAMALERSRGGDEDMEVDFRVIRRGGDTHYLRACARVVRDTAGGLKSLSGVCLDMTTLKRSEQILIQERRRYRDLVDSTDGLVWEADARSGQYTYVSRHAERLLGHPIEHWYQADFWQRHVHPDDREWVINYVSGMLARTEGYEVEYRMLASDGRPVWLRDIVTVVLEAGEPRWLRGVMIDITSTREIAEALRRSEEQLSLAIEGAGLGLWDWDIATGRLVLAGSGLAMLGYQPGEVEPHYDSWEALIHPDDRDEVRSRLVEHLRGSSERFVCEYRMRHKDDDRWVWIHGLGQVIHFDQNGVPLRAAGIQLDVTERRRAEERDRLSQREILRLSSRNELLLNSAGEGIFGVDVDGRCMFINPMALDLLGLSERDALERPCLEFFELRGDDGVAFRAEASPVVLTLADGMRRQVEETLVRRDGSSIAVRMTVTEMREGSERIGVEVMFQDISARRAMERELERLATTDPLTGVTNRRQFIERCEQELVRHKRFEDPVSLLMIDVDHFKRVNDTHGHAVGDEVLLHLCAMAMRELRRTDVFARLGGEEFAFLLTGSDLDGAMDFARRFRGLVESHPAITEAGAVPITISVGTAQARRQDRSADDLLRRADAALYRAKEGGRNQVMAQAPQ
ncbi:MAG: PAS domain S-box protein [Rhodocyclaceae bacterium]|nr:PAS domain S-box protein [Rhodocyclaceae bacterium]